MCVCVCVCIAAGTQPAAAGMAVELDAALSRCSKPAVSCSQPLGLELFRLWALGCVRVHRSGARLAVGARAVANADSRSQCLPLSFRCWRRRRRGRRGRRGRRRRRCSDAVVKKWQVVQRANGGEVQFAQCCSRGRGRGRARMSMGSRVVGLLLLRRSVLFQVESRPRPPAPPSKKRPSMTMGAPST